MTGRTTDVDGWLADLKRAAGEAMLRQVEAVVKRGALNVKNDWRKNATETAGEHAPAYPYSITFDDPVRRGLTISAEVGPDKDKRQGALGNLLEYGSAHNPPHNDGLRAADKEHPRFERALADVGEAMLLGGYDALLAGRP